jgi:hypothetical protein
MATCGLPTRHQQPTTHALTHRFPRLLSQDVSGVISAPRLEGLLNSFDPFETKMQEGTKARLLKDKLKVEAMARETDRLTNALSSQVQIRRQMNEQLQRFCEGKLDTCYTEYDALVLDQTTRVEERLEALDERITALDEHFQAEKERIKQEIEERHKELMEMLEKFHQLFEAECTVRAEREAAIKAEMAEHEKESSKSSGRSWRRTSRREEPRTNTSRPSWRPSSRSSSRPWRPSRRSGSRRTTRSRPPLAATPTSSSPASTLSTPRTHRLRQRGMGCQGRADRSPGGHTHRRRASREQDAMHIHTPQRERAGAVRLPSWLPYKLGRGFLVRL